MTAAADVVRPRDRKSALRRDQLAESALQTLGELGYARTSLRDIARETGQSLGVLHYYFANKEALLIHCVRQYKAGFVDLVQQALHEDLPPQARARTLCAALAASIANDAETHRLWYDIRAQAMFDDTFTAVVDEVEAGLVLMLAPLAPDPVAMTQLYVRLDGAFRYLLQHQLAGKTKTPPEMAAFLFDAGFAAD